MEHHRSTGASYPGANHPVVRQRNLAAIFRTIYAAAPIARVDLAARTGLNAKTVSNIVDELIRHDLVHELGYRTSPGVGRKAVELEIDPSARYVIGIDVALPSVTAALVDLTGRVRAQIVRLPTPKPWHIERTIPTAARAAERLIAALPDQERAKVVGIGVGAPGRFKIEGGHYLGLYLRDEVKWVDLGATGELDGSFGLPVTIDNNANTSALAELWFGTGRGVADFVLLNLSAGGIGMGMVSGGDVYRGGNQHVGEAGHITVNADGPRCFCGNFGCLAQYASARAVLGNVHTRLAAGEPSSLSDCPGLSIHDVIAAFHAKDPLATAVLADMTRYLAAALVSVVNIYDPRMILIGRDIATAGAAFFDRLSADLRGRLNPAVGEQIRIEAASVTDAPLIGAATLALREFFRTPITAPAGLPLAR